ncbi:hypothetical protein AGOR_G00244830 [Albula goreensis]|uniref:Uncharacterized protein n=1 Tax=Albula goreensis TaxID=1534307 RepID=A0A8T3CAU3_9TELE|nr:hypothetical protein AGOR_G00244830 [Albula goreensis]
MALPPRRSLNWGRINQPLGVEPGPRPSRNSHIFIRAPCLLPVAHMQITRTAQALAMSYVLPRQEAGRMYVCISPLDGRRTLKRSDYRQERALL